MNLNYVDPTSSLREAARCLNLALEQFHDAGMHPMHPAVEHAERVVQEALYVCLQILKSDDGKNPAAQRAAKGE